MQTPIHHNPAPLPGVQPEAMHTNENVITQLLQMLGDCRLIVEKSPFIVDECSHFIKESIWMSNDENDQIDHVNPNKLCTVVIARSTMGIDTTLPP